MEAEFGVFRGVEAGECGGWQKRIELIAGFDLPRDDFQDVALDGFGGFSGAIDGELSGEGFVQLFGTAACASARTSAQRQEDEAMAVTARAMDVVRVASVDED